MVDRLKDKVALVSGAGSSGPGWGNGKATAVLFAREGARVLAADINLDAALETKRITEAEGGTCEAVAGDVSRAADVAAVVDACISAFGRIDVLHNNVGIVEVGGPVETSEESWDRVKVRQGKGAIVNIASVSGIRWLGVPLHFLRIDQGSDHPLHAGHCSPICTVGHPRELDPAGNDEYADGAASQGRLSDTNVQRRDRLCSARSRAGCPVAAAHPAIFARLSSCLLVQLPQSEQSWR